MHSLFSSLLLLLVQQFQYLFSFLSHLNCIVEVLLISGEDIHPRFQGRFLRHVYAVLHVLQYFFNTCSSIDNSAVFSILSANEWVGATNVCNAKDNAKML